MATLLETHLRRKPDRLHMTVQPLGSSASYTPELFTRLIAALGAVQAAPFRLIFDRVHAVGGRAVLTPSEPLPAASAFHDSVVAALARAGFVITPRYRLSPHITVAYRGARPVSRPIDAISWLVEDFMLIESRHGHRQHGRWLLQAP
jgi:2'-5' RNA ligase